MAHGANEMNSQLFEMKQDCLVDNFVCVPSSLQKNTVFFCPISHWQFSMFVNKRIQSNYPQDNPDSLQKQLIPSFKAANLSACEYNLPSRPNIQIGQGKLLYIFEIVLHPQYKNG